MTSPIWFYVPNLIGYARVVTAIAAFYFAVDEPIYFLTLYSISFLLDAADGWAARTLDQSSKFGAVLDMATDRAGTASIVLVLAHLYPQHLFIFIMLNALDLGSHWLRMYSSMLVPGKSHKAVEAHHSHILNLYYSNRTVLGLTCLGNEFFYIFSYVTYFFREEALFVLVDREVDMYRLGALVCFPIFLLKQYLNLLQLRCSATDIVLHEQQSKKAG